MRNEFLLRRMELAFLTGAIPDMILALNGIPLATLELKNPISATRWNVEDAKRQYRFERDPKDPLYTFKLRCLVHFAVDTELVFMTTKLEGKETQFLPFNLGFNKGAGNPPVEGDVRTAYLWRNALTRDSLTDILARFVHLQVEEKSITTDFELGVLSVMAWFQQLLPVWPIIGIQSRRKTEGGSPMEHSQLMDERVRVDRRGFCKAVGVTTAVGLVEASLGSVLAHADLTKEQRDKMSPDEIIQQMKAGNERFRAGKPQHRDLMAEAKATAKGQYPAAVVFSCIDSRAPAELILDFGIGDIFSGRVAGDVADEDVLGSMEFACKVAGSKVVLVMGHTSCGAIKGVIDGVELGNLTALLSKIRPAVDATQYKGERSSKNYAFVDAVARENVVMTIANVRQRSPVLRDLESAGSIKIAGAMYNLETGTVEFLG